MKAKFLLKGDVNPPPMEELVYEVDGVMHGGFTLLSSPDDTREYEFDTSAEMIGRMKKSTTKYTFIKLIEETE